MGVYLTKYNELLKVKYISDQSSLIDGHFFDINIKETVLHQCQKWTVALEAGLVVITSPFQTNVE